MSQTLARFHEQLLKRGLVSNSELESATRTATERGASVEETLIALGLVTEDQVGGLLAEELGLSYVFPDAGAIAPELIRRFPAGILARHHAVPLLDEGEHVVVAISEPLEDETRRVLESACGRPISVALASRRRIDRVLAETSAAPPAASPDPGAVSVLYGNLAKAIASKATEIRFESDARGIAVRHRIDGRLVEQARAPSNLMLPLLARTRMLGSGRVRTRIGPRDLTLDIAEIATREGAAVLIRIVPQVAVHALDAIKKNSGLICVPDRESGYELLRQADAATRCIVSIDTVAADFPGIRQVEAGPLALRAALDYRPDVLFVADVHEIDMPALFAASTRRVVVVVREVR